MLYALASCESVFCTVLTSRRKFTTSLSIKVANSEHWTNTLAPDPAIWPLPNLRAERKFPTHLVSHPWSGFSLGVAMWMSRGR